jgi:hypothetical protein
MLKEKHDKTLIMPDMRAREMLTTVFIGSSSTGHESVSTFKSNVKVYNFFSLVLSYSIQNVRDFRVSEPIY